MSLTRAEQKKIRSLRTAKARRERGQFAAEGVRLLEEALRHKYMPKRLFVVPNLLTDRAEYLIDNFDKEGTKSEVVSQSQIEYMTDSVTSQGILALFGLPGRDLAQLYKRSHRKIVLCDSISDPGNMGTLIRSAAAFGFNLMLLKGQCVDPYSPKVVRSSVGAIFRMRIAPVTDIELPEFLKSNRIKLITTSLDGSHSDAKMKTVMNSGNIMLAIGSEADGLSGELLSLADLKWRIKHTSAVESLNAAVAGSIIMKQVYDLAERSEKKK